MWEDTAPAMDRHGATSRSSSAMHPHQWLFKKETFGENLGQGDTEADVSRITQTGWKTSSKTIFLYSYHCDNFFFNFSLIFLENLLQYFLPTTRDWYSSL